MTYTKGISIVGIGPGDPEMLTLAAVQAMQGRQRVILRTGAHPVAQWLDGQGVAYETLDALYEQAEDFDQLVCLAGDYLVNIGRNEPVVYAVPGMAGAQDGTVQRLMQACQKEGIPCRHLPGIAPESIALSAYADSMPGYRVAAALQLAPDRLNCRIPLVVTELHSAIAASNVKLALGEVYPDAHIAVFFIDGQTPQPIALFEIDRQVGYDHRSMLLIPPIALEGQERYGFEDLMDIMAILRAPGGCPWDREQTHRSLKPCLIEEAYEVLEAIDQDDMDKLADELGDLLVQVAYHAQLAAERRDFTARDVTSNICRKLIRRHEHIFGNAKIDTAQGVISAWERIKKREKQLQSQTEVLRDIPRNLPALMRAFKVLKKAELAGVAQTMPQAVEAARQALEEAEKGEVQAYGALLWSVADITRLAGIEPECLLGEATDAFIADFTHAEAQAVQQGQTIQHCFLERKAAGKWV